MPLRIVKFALENLSRFLPDKKLISWQKNVDLKVIIKNKLNVAGITRDRSWLLPGFSEFSALGIGFLTLGRIFQDFFAMDIMDFLDIFFLKNWNLIERYPVVIKNFSRVAEKIPALPHKMP